MPAVRDRSRRARVAPALAAALAVAAAGALAACGSDEPDAAATLRVLAGSEVKDMLPILEDAETATGVHVELEYSGSIQGTETVASGGAAGTYDATWFPNNRYLSLLPGASAQVADSVKVMSSPVVLGLAPDVASRLGWDRTAPTWAQIAQAAEDGSFTYGMTNPAASNSGFSALVSVATALSGTGAALTVDDIDRVVPQLRGFSSAQRLTAGSSGWLASTYQNDPSAVDGLVNYESVLLSLEQQGVPLTVVVPTDGVVMNDYPLTLLTSADASKKALFDTLTDWLTTPDVQQRIVRDVHRRPGVPGIDTGDAFPTGVLFETPFPNTIDVANTLISTYLEAVRRPSQEVFVLDTSGSMDGDRIDALRQALKNLAGADTSTLGGFAKFRSGERVTLLPFSNRAGSPTVIDIPESRPDAAYTQITDYADGLRADGGTAIYDSLEEALRLAAEQRAERPDTYVSVVLMTDGENTDGASYEDFERAYPGLGADGIPAFVVLFGDANVDEMKQVAALTGGQTFDALNGDLAQAFQDIRGYQ